MTSNKLPSRKQTAAERPLHVNLGPKRYEIGRQLRAIVTEAENWEAAAEQVAALFHRLSGFLAAFAAGSDEKIVALRNRVADLEADNVAMRAALLSVPRIAEEIRLKWDEGMRAGKLLIALIDPRLRYRPDTTFIHEAAVENGRPRWRHEKSGGTYTEVGRAKVQASVRSIGENDTVVVYQGKDGRLWAREECEFSDGRFIRVERQAEQHR